MQPGGIDSAVAGAGESEAGSDAGEAQEADEEAPRPSASASRCCARCTCWSTAACSRAKARLVVSKGGAELQEVHVHVST